MKGPVDVRAYLQKPFDDRRVLSDTAHVKHILSIVFIREINVVEEEGEVLEQPLGKMEVNSRPLEEADVEDSLTDAAAVFNLRTKVRC